MQKLLGDYATRDGGQDVLVNDLQLLISYLDETIGEGEELLSDNVFSLE